MTSDLKEARTIVVTGGAHGIGRAVVLLCAARGDKVAVLDKIAEGAKTTAHEAMQRGANTALGLVCDVGSEEEIEKAFEIIWNKIGAPYGLFTSATVDLGGHVQELAAATWHQVLPILSKAIPLGRLAQPEEPARQSLGYVQKNLLTSLDHLLFAMAVFSQSIPQRMNTFVWNGK